MTEITKDLYQFSIYIPPMDFTIHQYLDASEPSILFAAGTVQQAKQILPEIKDLMLRYGNGAGNTIKAAWHDEVDSIGADRIRDDEQRKELQRSLKQIDPRFVAVGHGYCIKCELNSV